MKIENAVRNANSDSSINGNWTPKYCPEKKKQKDARATRIQLRT